MDTVTKEAVRGRRRRAGLARRGLRESTGQRKAGRQGRRPSPQHARLAGHVEPRRSRHVCRTTEAIRLTNTRQLARRSETGSTNPTTGAARGGEGMTLSPRAPASAHTRGFDIGPRPTATVSGWGQAGSSTAHLAGCLAGCRTPSQTRRRSPARVGHSSPSPLSAYQHLEPSRQVSRHATGRHCRPRWKTPVRHLWHTLSLQQEL